MKWVVVVAVFLAGLAAVLLLREDEPRPPQHSPQAVSPATDTPTSASELPASTPTPAPADEVDTAYLRRARTADIRRALHDPDLPLSVSDFLLDQGLPATVRSLEELAQLGDADANVALARLDLYCDGREQLTIQEGEIFNARRIEPQSRSPPPEYFAGCSAAAFNRTAIEARLRDAADAGHTPSLLLLGQESDEATRRKLWTSAAMLGDPRAQLAISALLRHDTGTGPISQRAAFWLNVAAKNSIPARTALAICRAEGCDGKPADELTALEQLRNAARQGDQEALARLAEQAPSFPQDLGPDERYAWLTLFRDLWRHGCYGMTQPPNEGAGDPDDLLRNAEQGLSPFALKSARELAESYRKSYSVEAKRAQRCT